MYQRSKAILAGNNTYGTSMKNCYIKASEFCQNPARPGGNHQPQGWRRMGPGVVKWPCVCDLKCECGRSGILNVISCDAVNYGCQLSTVNHCQLSSARPVLILNGTLSTAVTSSPVAGCRFTPETFLKGFARLAIDARGLIVTTCSQ